jgi:transcriptional regulator with XRE-family HTH domain
MNELSAKYIGNNLIKLRAKKGWSQLELSRKSGLTQQHISGLECGKFGIPKVDSLLKLSEAFDCTLYDIIYFPIADSTRIKDDSANYGSSLKKTFDILSANQNLAKFISIEVDYLYRLDKSHLSQIVELFELIIKLDESKISKIIDMINIISD